MLSIRSTKLGYYASVGFFKMEDDVCCGQPYFYTVATDLSDGMFALDFGIADEDDYDIYDWVYFTDRDAWLRAFNYVVCEYYDKRYLRSCHLRDTFDTYVRPLITYLSAS